MKTIYISMKIVPPVDLKTVKNYNSITKKKTMPLGDAPVKGIVVDSISSEKSETFCIERCI